MSEKPSRRQGRYLRRQEKRKAKLIERNEAVGSLEDVFTYGEMYAKGKKCCKGVRWKASTQNFERHLFSGTAVSRRQILNGIWKASKYNHFMLHERGKIRPIDAPRIQDRQVHKTFTSNVLLPLYKPSMIYNNGASLPGKGFDFSRRMLISDLHWHFRRYGTEGNVILLDFKKFFPSVSHDELYKRHDRIILDTQMRNFADAIVASIGRNYGLPLGVEPSQAEMIAFPSALDNFIKCQLSIRCAGHYMDDYYIVVPPDGDVKKILECVIAKAESLKLTVNRSKTKIAPISKPFKYCKLKYTLTDSGKVVVNGCRDSMKRARKKFKTFQRMIDNKEMTYEDLWSSVNGIVAYFEKYNDHNRVLKLRRLFYALFGFSCESIAGFREMDLRKGNQYEICVPQTV